MIKLYLLTLSLPFLIGCHKPESKNNPATILPVIQNAQKPYVTVLGTIQDGGSPHIGCTKECCRKLFIQPDPDRLVVSLGIIDPQNKKTYLIEATPDMPKQMKLLQAEAGFSDKQTPEGIFLTHAHIGHYTGLMYLGREALGSEEVPVYAMPRMKDYLESNGPWSQLVELNNITLEPLTDGQPIALTPLVQITPIRVPHRDEFSETVGYRITGPEASLLFIPDIDKWNKWETDIRDEISKVDYALLDGSFYDGDELSNRDMSEIPHPFLVESMEYFSQMPESERKKIHFIHFNHTNPVLSKDPEVLQRLKAGGYSVCSLSDRFNL